MKKHFIALTDRGPLDLRFAHEPTLHAERESAQARRSRRLRQVLQPQESSQPQGIRAVQAL